MIPSIMMGIVIGLCVSYRKRYQKAMDELIKRKIEKEEADTWEEFEQLRDAYGYSSNREHMYKKKKYARIRTPRKKHRY